MLTGRCLKSRAYSRLRMKINKQILGNLPVYRISGNRE
jgi:hypothetical protein